MKINRSNRFLPLLRRLFAGPLALFGLLGIAQATEISWNGATSTAWATGTNWDGVVAPANSITTDTVSFSLGTYLNQPNAGTTSIAGIKIGNGATTAALTLAGTQLTIGASGIEMMANAAASTVSTPTTLGADQIWQNASANKLTASGAVTNAGKNLTVKGTGNTDITASISGAGSLTKADAGTLSLTTGNPHTGGTFVNGGVLNLGGGGGANGTIRGTATVNAGAILRLGTGDATGYDGTNRLGIINLVGGNMDVNTTSNQTLGSATINMTGASITGIAGSNLDFFAGSSKINVLASGTPSTISGVQLSPLRQGNTTFTVENGAAAFDLDISSVMRIPGTDNPAAVLTKAGPGTMRLTGLNTLDRSIAIIDGALEIGGAGVIGNGNYTSSIPNAGILKLNSTANQVLAGAITGTGSLVKDNTGTVTLGGGNSYTGATTINSGTLAIGDIGINPSTDITVKNTGKLQVNLVGKTLQSLTVENGSGLNLAASSPGTTTIANTLSFTGSPTVTVAPLFPSNPVAGSYDLLTAGTVSGSPSLVTDMSAYAGSRAASSTTTTLVGGKIVLTVGTGFSELVWNNQAGSGNRVWSLNNPTDANFKNGAANDYFSNLDGVTFNGAATGNVTLVGSLRPSQISVTSSSGDYFFTGSGSITGSAPLLKTGSSTLTLGTDNSTYTGTISLGDGVLAAGHPAAFGPPASAKIDFGSSAGTLRLNANSVTLASLNALGGTSVIESRSPIGSTDVLTIASATANTYDGVLRDGASGKLSLTNTGVGNLTLSGAGSNTFTGPLTISTAGNTNAKSVFFAKTDGAFAVGENGSVVFGTGTTGESNLRMMAPEQFGAGTVMSFLNPSGSWGRFDLRGTNQTLAGLSSGTATTGMGAVIQNRSVNDTANYGTATLTLNGSGSYLYNGYLRDADSGASATNLLNLVKSGTGTQTLAGTNVSYTGTTMVNGGTLLLDRGTNVGSNDYFNSAGGITISSGAILQVNQDGAAGTGGRFSNVNRPITGSGTFRKTGPGTTYLANNGGATNTGINLSAGGLVDIQGGALNSMRTLSTNIGSLNIAAGATANFNNNTTVGQANDAYFDQLTGGGAITFDAGIARRINVGVLDGSSNYSGTIATAALSTLTKVGSGTFTLAGAADNTGLLADVSSGILTLGKTSSGAGTSGAGVRAVGGVSNLASGAALSLGGTGGDQIFGFGTGPQGRVVMTGGILDFHGSSEGWDRLQGSGLVTNTLASTSSVMTLGENGGSSSFSGVIENGAGTMALTKVGSGVFTLGGTNTYTGPTTINAGTLQVDGSLTASPVTVADGGILAGEGSVKSITLGSTTGGKLLVNPTTSGALSTTGSVAIVGGVTVSLANSGFTPGTPFSVLNFGSKSGAWSASNFSVADAASYRGVSFAETAGSITMTVSNRELSWNNASSDATWNTNDSVNFFASDISGNSSFLWPDKVTFGDLPGANQTVLVEGVVQPGSMTFNSQYNYVLNDGGGAAISGSTNLIKSGSGTLSLNFANSFTGATTLSLGTLNAAAGSLGTSPVTVTGGIFNAIGATVNGNAPVVLTGGSFNANGPAALGSSQVAINGGVLSLGNATAHGTSTLTFGGGILQYAAGITADVSNSIKNSAAPIRIDTNGQSPTFASVLDASNTAGLVKNGVGTLTLGAGANTYLGATTVDGGTLRISNDLQLGVVPAAPTVGSIVLNGPGMLGVGANTTVHANRGIAISFGGGIDTSLAGNGGGTLPTIAGLISGTGGLVVKSNGSTADDGGGANSYTMISNAGNNFTGDVTITAGVVRVDGGFGDPANRILLNGGGLVDSGVNIPLARAIQVGAANGYLRTYGGITMALSGPISNMPGVANAMLRHTDTGTVNLSGSGAGYAGTFYNGRGATVISAANASWQNTDFVMDTGGGTLSFNGGGTARVKSINSTRDVLIENGTMLDLGTGNLTMATNGHWVKTSAGALGALTSSSGVLTVTNGATSGALAALDHQLQVTVKDFNGSTPLALVKNNTNLLVLGQANTYSGGTTINLGRVQASNAKGFGTGSVLVKNGAQAYLSAGGGIYTNNITLNGIGVTEGALNLGALRMESATLAGNLTIASPSRIANNGAAIVSTLTGALTGTSDLEINSAAQAANTGTVNLNGVATGYSGVITVSGGRLNVNSAVLGQAGGATSSVVVADGKGLGGEGEVSGNITLGNTANLTVDPSSPAALMADGLLTTSGTVSVSLGASVAGSSAALPTSGTPFKVIGFGTQAGIPAGATNFTLANSANYRPGATFTRNVNDVSLALAKESLEWNNAGADLKWNTNLTTNFRNATTTLNDKFFWGDDVLFGNLPGAAQIIAIDGTQNPSTVTVNSQYDYTLNNGTAGVIASGSLLKSGTGLLTVNLANTYAGGTVVRQGELRLGNAAAAGIGTITLGDASSGASAVTCLFGGGGNPANDIVVSSSGTGPVTFGTFSGGVSTPTGNVTLNRAAVISDSTGDRTTFNGKISGNPGTITVSKGRVTFGNATNNFVGDLLVSSGAIYQNDSPTALPVITSVAVDNGTFRLNNGSIHAINKLTGTGTTTIIAGGNSTLSLGNNGGSGSYLGTVVDGAGILSVIKNGAGTQSLVGVNTFTGTTDVNAGTLIVGPRVSGGATNVADGATFGIGGAPGSAWNTTTLTLGSSTGATLLISNFDSNIAPSVTVSTGLVTHGIVPVKVAGSFTVGTFPLISYPVGAAITGSGFSAFNLVLPPNVSGSLVNNTTNSSVDLVITSVDPLLWTGSPNGNWDINATANWKLSGSPDKYQEGMIVKLDDTATGTTAINLTTAVTPGDLQVANETKNYILGGAGSITGATRLTKSGAAKLTITSLANSYLGGTVVNGGTLELGNGTNNGSTPGAVTNNALVKFNNGPAQTFGAAIGGTGAVEKSGAGTLSLTAASTFLGNLTVHEGKLVAAGARTGTNTVFGSAVTTRSITVEPAASLEFQVGNTFGGHNFAAAPALVVNGSTAVNAVTSNNSLSEVFLNGGTLTSTAGSASTIGGSRPTETYGTWNLNGAVTSTGNSLITTGAPINGQVMLSSAGVDTAFHVSDTLTIAAPLQSGDAGYLSGLSKDGSGTLVLSAANIYTGPTKVLGGELRLTGSLVAGSAVTVSTGGTLSGSGAANGIVAVELDGTVAPGVSGIGTLNLGRTTLAGTYACELDGSLSDKLVVTGNLNLNGATIAIQSLTAPTASSYVIATYTGTLSGVPTVTGLPAGFVLDVLNPGQVRLVSGGYSVWMAQKGLDSTNNGITQDPDDDGMNNLLEFYLDGDPLVSDSGSLMTSSLDGSYLRIAFRRRDDAEIDTSSQLAQFSVNLSQLGWTPATIGAGSSPADANGVIVNVAENLAAPDNVEVLIPRSKAVNGKLFGRIKIGK